MSAMRMRIVVSLLIGCVTVNFARHAVGQNSRCEEIPDGFVYPEGTRLKLNGGDFYFSGANTYRMLYSEADAEALFETAAEQDLNAIRFWGFWNGEDLNPQYDENGFMLRPGSPDTDLYGHYVLQSRPGVYPELGWRKFDYAIYLANVYGIKLIIPLMNNWLEFGGVETYIEWAGIDMPDKADYPGHYQYENRIKLDRDNFWHSPEARQLYYDFVEHTLNRVNVYTGVAYKDDPAVMIWEVMNEPRYGPWDEDRTRGEVIRDFLAEASAFIKSIDPCHMVSSGEEGFFSDGVYFDGEDERDRSAYYPWTAGGGEGVDFLLNAEIDTIDILSVHAWPFQWSLWKKLPDGTPDYDDLGIYADLWNFSTEWVQAHAVVSERVQKPMYLGEFGFQILRREESNVEYRDHILEASYDAAREWDIAGMAYWVMTSSHDPDEYVYQGDIERDPILQGIINDAAVPHDVVFQFDVYCPEDETTCDLIDAYTQETLAKVENPDPPYERVFPLPCIEPRTVCEAPCDPADECDPNGDTDCGPEDPSQGVCDAESGLRQVCVLLDSHPDHCGACDGPDAICGDDETCRDGTCVALASLYSGTTRQAADQDGDGCSTVTVGESQSMSWVDLVTALLVR